jgi:hypothetical protein
MRHGPHDYKDVGLPRDLRCHRTRGVFEDIMSEAKLAKDEEVERRLLQRPYPSFVARHSRV